VLPFEDFFRSGVFYVGIDLVHTGLQPELETTEFDGAEPSFDSESSPVDACCPLSGNGTVTREEVQRNGAIRYLIVN